MNEKKRHFTLTRLLLLGAIVAAAVFFYWKRSNDFSDVPFVTVEQKKGLVVYAEGAGQLNPGKEIFLTVNKGGRLDKLYVKEGASVTKGQILGIVEETDRSAGLESALSSFRLASSDLQRMRRLYQAHSTTLQDLDEAKQRFDVRKSELEKAKQLMEDGLLRSPSDGRLSLMAFSVNDVIPDGSRVAVIEDHSFYQIVVKLPSDFRRVLPKGAEIELRAINPQTGAFGNPVSAKAEISLPNLESDFDGLYVDVMFILAKLPEGLKPREAFHIKVPVATYKEAAILSRSALSWKDSHPRLLLQDEKGQLSWFEPEIGISQEDQVVILNLPLRAKVVSYREIKDSKRLKKIEKGG